MYCFRLFNFVYEFEQLLSDEKAVETLTTLTRDLIELQQFSTQFQNLTFDNCKYILKKYVDVLNVGKC